MILVWVLYTKNGALFPASTTYWWAWFSGFFSIVCPYSLAALVWPFTFVDDMKTAHDVFVAGVTFAITGPMLF